MRDRQIQGKLCDRKERLENMSVKGSRFRRSLKESPGKSGSFRESRRDSGEWREKKCL